MNLLDVEDLHTTYMSNGREVRAVSGVSFSLGKGETVGLVGESGCGKSTLGKTILQLVPANAGTVRLNGEDVSALRGRDLIRHRRKAQMIFQDPFGSLNPRQSIERILATPLKVHTDKSAAERKQVVATILEKVGLSATDGKRFPHEFSGGQRQRIGIARALVLNPELIVCDEPVSALDVSVQAQILNLLVGLKAELSLSYLFISHDLSVVRYFADRILVMYLGKIVESAPRESLWQHPKHPYTMALLDAIPSADRRNRHHPTQTRTAYAVENRSQGCPFVSRCPKAMDVCNHTPPRLLDDGLGHSVACHLHG